MNPLISFGYFLLTDQKFVDIQGIPVFLERF